MARQAGTLPTPRAIGPRVRWSTLLLWGGLLVVFGWSAVGTNFSLAEALKPENLKATNSFIAGLFPPETSPAFLSQTLSLVVETIQISIVGTIVAIVLAIPLAVLAHRHRGEETSRAALGTGPWLLGWGAYYLARGVLNLLRAVPELVWALIFVVMVGLGPFPGVLALAAHSTGILGKLYAEMIETVNQNLVEAGRSTGASDLSVLAFVQVPSVLPMLLSYTLFRWECNMRAATVLGFVGAGGLGTQLVLSMKLFRYNEVLTLALVILGLVVVIDLVGQFVRTQILDQREQLGCEPVVEEQRALVS